MRDAKELRESLLHEKLTRFVGVGEVATAEARLMGCWVDFG